MVSLSAASTGTPCVRAIPGVPGGVAGFAIYRSPSGGPPGAPGREYSPASRASPRHAPDTGPRDDGAFALGCGRGSRGRNASPSAGWPQWLLGLVSGERRLLRVDVPPLEVPGARGD